MIPVEFDLSFFVKCDCFKSTNSSMKSYVPKFIARKLFSKIEYEAVELGRVSINPRHESTDQLNRILTLYCHSTATTDTAMTTANAGDEAVLTIDSKHLKAPSSKHKLKDIVCCGFRARVFAFVAGHTCHVFRSDDARAIVDAIESRDESLAGEMGGFDRRQILGDCADCLRQISPPQQYHHNSSSSPSGKARNKRCPKHLPLSYFN